MAHFKNSNNCVACSRKCAIFSLLGEDELNLLEEQRYEVRYKAGEIIFKQGTTATHIISFAEGLAKIYLEGYSGRDLILGLIKPTKLIAGPGIVVDARHHYSMAALQDSMACFIDLNTVKELIRRNKAFGGMFMQEMGRQTIHSFEKLISITQKHMHGRIAEALLYMSDNIFLSKEFDMIVSRQELADMAGLSKESACRILKEFKDEKIIQLKGNQIDLLKYEALEQISKTG